MKNRTGFTLIELVVVILILGILAGVAAPKLFDTSAKASDNSARTTLSIVRDAIELFAAENGSTLPRGDNEANFQADIMLFLRGTVFPTCPVGANAGTNTVSVDSSTGGDEGWRYYGGEFFINSAANTANTADVGTLTYDAL